MARSEELRLVDLPTISRQEAAAIFGWHAVRFQKTFDRVHHQIIRYQDSTKGRRYLLTDCYKAAYPEASNEAIHLMCQKYMWRAQGQRRVKKNRPGGDDV